MHKSTPIICSKFMMSERILFFVPEMAKPGIPVSPPRRRSAPEVPDPKPIRIPVPAQPATPKIPVPVR